MTPLFLNQNQSRVDEVFEAVSPPKQEISRELELRQILLKNLLIHQLPNVKNAD